MYALDITAGGPFTRYDTSDPQNKDQMSLVDYVVVSSKLVNHVKKFEIDSQ